MRTNERYDEPAATVKKSRIKRTIFSEVYTRLFSNRIFPCLRRRRHRRRRRRIFILTYTIHFLYIVCQPENRKMKRVKKTSHAHCIVSFTSL